MADIKVSDLYKLIAEGNMEQAKEAMMQKDAYSGKEVCELLEAVMKRIDGLEAKIGFSGEVNEENLGKIKEDLKQKVGNFKSSSKIPENFDEYRLTESKASAFEQTGKLNEAGELYILSDCFRAASGRTSKNFLYFCSRQKNKLNARFLDKYAAVLPCINKLNDPKKIGLCLLHFYSTRAKAYEEFGDKESAKKDHEELQKILEKM